MEITDIKEARNWLHEILKPNLTKAVSDQQIHEAVILNDDTIILTTSKGKYLSIQVSVWRDN